MSPRLGVVLVNWRGAADTLECLESLTRAGLALRVVVVDNASGDGSVERILAWARGDAPAVAAAPAMAWLTEPPCPKPVACRHVAQRDDAVPGGEWLTVIEAGGNLGFAGGNNIGLAYLLRDPGVDHVWLLNNDTVAEAAAPAALLAALDATPNVGMCGTIVRYYHRPGVRQALNGSRFSVWTGTSRSIGGGSAADARFDTAAVVRDTDFVLGASLGVSRAFVEAVGPMEEGYFLYFEEVDWAYRARGRFATGFAAGATVYHKEGGSIGSSGRRGGRSALSEYYLMRSRLAFVRRFRPVLLPLHWTVAAAQIALRLGRRQPGLARAMMRALLGLKA